MIDRAMNRWHLCNIVVLLTAIACCRDAAAQLVDPDKPDTVTVRSTDGREPRRIRGKIIDWTGSVLSLQAGARTRSIDGSQVMSVETSWAEAAVEARRALAMNDFPRAIALLDQASAQEQRPWAKQMLRVDLIRAWLATEQVAPAMDEYAALVGNDPSTRLLSVAPMAWMSHSNVGAVMPKATKWLTAEVPVMQLVGASWLIGTAQQEAALQQLEKLSRDIDERIARLATAQTWRARRSVDVRLIDSWRNVVATLPSDLQAGPWFVLADREEAAGRNDHAVAAWMRLPILHADRPDLAAAALYRSTRLLHNIGSADSATLVQQELAKTYPDSSWTQRTAQDN